ncbi:ankyrin repeat-containing domain protein [Chytridium lagenaria]|nr:ankyrin repeat-containing domain protein [Chytridium lagenaria]
MLHRLPLELVTEILLLTNDFHLILEAEFDSLGLLTSEDIYIAMAERRESDFPATQKMFDASEMDLDGNLSLTRFEDTAGGLDLDDVQGMKILENMQKLEKKKEKKSETEAMKITKKLTTTSGNHVWMPMNMMSAKRQTSLKRMLKAQQWTDKFAAMNYFLFLKWVHLSRIEISVSSFEEAAKHGYVDIIEWMIIEDIAPWSLKRDLTRQIVENDNLELLKVVKKNGMTVDVDSEGLEIAASKGNLHMVKWLCTMAPLDCRKAMIAAAVNGHLDIVKWFFEENPVMRSNQAVNMAARAGQLEIVKWLLENHNDGCSSDAMDGAATMGHFDVVIWLHGNNRDCTNEAMDGAATNGFLNIVQWLCMNRKEGCSQQAMDGAARNGFLDIVKWLHENRTEGCTVAAMDGAAEYGYLEVVKWLHKNRTEGCTKLAMTEAARNGCDHKAMDLAAEEGEYDIVEFLHDFRQEGCTTNAMDMAAWSGHLEILRFLYYCRLERFNRSYEECRFVRPGCTTQAMDRAAENGHLHIVKFLDRHRQEGCTVSAMDEAAANGHLLVVRWLHVYRLEGCSSRAVDRAVENGHRQVVKFLLLFRTEGFSEEALRYVREVENDSRMRIMLLSIGKVSAGIGAPQFGWSSLKDAEWNGRRSEDT